MNRLSKMARRVEDLLDLIVEDNIVINKKNFGQLLASIGCFDSLAREIKPNPLEKN